ncbi:MAG: transcription-repair coupling factor [Nitrospirae bacterium]|nr:transcription-repair coupling factor [Nitrospirota bacterium]
MISAILYCMPLNLSVFEDALRALYEKRTDAFTSLSGSSGALFFSMIKSPCLLLCATEESAGAFCADALFWSRLLETESPLLIHPKDDPQRLTDLNELYTHNKGKIISSVDAAFSPLWKRKEFPVYSITKGVIIDRDVIVQQLQRQGYHVVPVVTGEGEMSMRGGILDIYPPDNEYPVRIEFFGDEIESVRFFDIDTQLSVKEINDIQVCPAIEPEEGPDLIELLSDSLLILNEPDDIKRHRPEMEELIIKKIPLTPPLPKGDLTVPPLEKGLGSRCLEELQREAGGFDTSDIPGRRTVTFTSLPLHGEGFHFPVNSPAGLGVLPEERSSVEDFVKKVIELKKQFFVLMTCSSEGQAKRLKELFFDSDTDAPILGGSAAKKDARSPVITIGELSRGFSYQDVVILSATDIFGQRPSFKSAKKSRVSAIISSIEDFKEGDYLVHDEHGIGKFLGLKKEKIEDYEGDFIVVEYLDSARLYVPLEHINTIRKYHAAEGVRPKTDRLGGKTWEKTKQKVKQKIRDLAEKLLAIYARRSTAQGFAFSADTEMHREFDTFFPYEATPDQVTSINEIKRDMESPVPMDRLLCGDVGYGKTEVVMRACFKAVCDSKQVAVLVPTTILAEQHFETFTARFSAFPVKIDYLSRFKNRAEQKQTLKALTEGGVDIIIGTHRLIAKDVSFYDLGLLVIDEEHKFGVAHKEKLKALSEGVDVLSLSATPIPRTLHMALSGIRVMSVIETPPEDRLAVKSAVARFNPALIKEALDKELERGGQVFFVHNRIQDIYKIGNFLRELTPEAKIGVAHGQMNEKELEGVMRAFFHKEINVLVSTAIIGSGLDIPSANTIIINRADRFGLADLYQLRGRVGRSNVRAYAYFLIPGEDIITEDARKKLQAIQELGYLGAGFRLAMKDLEIRGAGNLLGAEQSGHIEAVGFDMYMEMLEQAVAELKGEKIEPKLEPVIDMKITAVIPEDYIEDPDLRLSVYRKIASARDIKALERLSEELKDRFGTPPKKTRRLLEVMELKVLAKELHIAKIQNFLGRIQVVFAPDTPVTSEKIFSLYNTRKKVLKYLPEGGIELDLRGKDWELIFREVKGVMEELR